MLYEIITQGDWDNPSRWVYEGVIDDPHGEFFIAEDKSLQKVLL